ncbi:MAG: AAA family ATPase [Alphaproteobacteria bacterium]
MRIRALTMERYGVFERRGVAFPGDGLTVVYGPNEAGKSTCLAAVGDLIFGIPQQSAMGQVFGYDAMRIGAKLELADGRPLTLRRRKGRARTLTDGDGRPLDEGVLAPHLGATTRERFQSLFGLDHATLRQGGADLLGADGDIGRLILEAGGGLRALTQRIEALDREIDSLFATRKAEHRLFYRAVDALADAHRAVQDGQVTRERFQAAEAAAADARDRVAELRRRRSEAEIARKTAERLVRVLPQLRDLDRLAAEIAAAGTLPPAPAVEAAAIRTAIQRRDMAAQAEREAVAARAAVLARIAAVATADPLLAAEGAIETIAEKAAAVRQARRDRANRHREIDAAQTPLDALRRRIGAPRERDLAPLVPDRRRLEALQTLIAEGERLRARLAELDSAMHERDARIAIVEMRMRALATAGRDRPLGFAAGDLNGLPAAARLAAAGRAAADAAAQTLAARAAAIGFASVEALRALPCPDRAAVEMEAARRRESAERIDRHVGERDAAGHRHRRAATTVDRLARGGPVADEAAVAAARAGREAAWEPIRAAFLDAEKMPPAAERSQRAADFEARVGEADTLADRRSTEAARAAEMAAAERDAAEAAAAVAEAEAALHRERARAEAGLAAWRAAWPEAAALHDEPGRLKTFVEERREIIAALDLAAAERRETETAAAELAAALDRLAEAEARLTLSPAAGATVVARAAAVAAAIAQAEEEHADHRALVAAHAAAMAEHARDGEAHRRLAARLAAWAPERRAAMAAVALDPAASDAEALDTVNLWLAADGHIRAVGHAERRLRRMDEDESELRGLTAGLAAAIPMTLPEDAVAAATLLTQHLTQAREAAAQRRVLDAQHAEAEAAERARKEALVEAVTSLAALADRHRCAAIDLPARADALDAAAKLLEARRSRADALAAAGDGEPEDALRALCAGRDLDHATAGLALLREEAAALDAEHEAAVTARDAADAALAGLAAAAGVNEAIARREAAAAELRVVTGRYVELSMARTLLQAAVDRIRSESQDPLILRAGVLMAAATAGAFAGVEADVDDRGNPVVVGRRAGGERVPVSQMSDGTRDQLFLAFRIASIERYCMGAEPLPFVADDLLVHFDDARSAATLDLLAELGRTTQVLLFTHHGSVVEAARRLGDRIRVAELT